METVLATFDDSKAAQDAVDQLIEQGFARASVHLQSGPPGSGGNGVMASVGHFFSSLFESDDPSHAGHYSEAVRRGGTVVAVDAKDSAEVEEARAVMQQYGTVDLEQRAARWKKQGWRGFDPNSSPMTPQELASERDSVPVVQEDLVVGKQKVNVGGLRIVKRISQVPISQVFHLRQEKATVKRTPVNRPATEADFQNFKEGTFEVRETAEEAVISKSAHVIEEVSIAKTATDHAQSVSDTVRRTNVDVERIPAPAAALHQP